MKLQWRRSIQMRIATCLPAGRLGFYRSVIIVAEDSYIVQVCDATADEQRTEADNQKRKDKTLSKTANNNEASKVPPSGGAGGKKNPLKAVGGLFNAKWLTGNMNFFLFLSLLAVLYIANGHMADKTIRNIAKTQKELKELQFEYKTIKSEVMFKSEEAQVLKASEPLGLKISSEVPQRLQLQTTVERKKKD